MQSAAAALTSLPLLLVSPVCNIVLSLFQQQQGEPPGSLACPKHVWEWPAGGQHTWASGTAEGGRAQTAERSEALRAAERPVWWRACRSGFKRLGHNFAGLPQRRGSTDQSCFAGSDRAKSCLAASGPAAFCCLLPFSLLGSGSAAWKSAPTLGLRSTPTPYLHWQGCRADANWFR